MKKWEKDFEATFELDELKYRPCTDEDLITKDGQLQTEYGFFKVDERSSALGENITNRFKCIDEPYDIWGNYDSDRGKNLMIVYELCDPEIRSTCKSQEEISDAL